jgi:hypothetical protein
MESVNNMLQIICRNCASNTKPMQPIKNRLLLFCIVSLGVIASCKKNDEVLAPYTPTTPTTPGGTGSGPLTADMMKDSSFVLAKDIYLWNTQIPSSFDARAYSDLNKVMEGIRPYSQEPGFSLPVDRWSFAMTKTEWEQISGGRSSSFGSAVEAAGDFGITVFFRVEGDLRVRLVEPNSPAGLAGVRRGWRIVQINGNSNITTANSNFIVNNIYSSNSATVTFQKPDGSNSTITLNAAHYAQKPVYLDTIYNIGSKRIGYLVFNSFLGNVSQIEAQLDMVFSSFAGSNVTDVIVDLRYNGGGYVSLQEKLADYLVSTSANGQLMMKQVYNANNSQNNHSTYFHKRGAINISDVYFIVGRGTASASELLINNLKPYMDVKLVGGTTHGKPVGYFPIPVADWYIFPVSFRTTNKNNEGNYFNGFPVNAQVADGLDKDWGDLNETSLASAVNHITTGTYQRAAPYHEPSSVASGNATLESSLLKITVDNKRF